MSTENLRLFGERVKNRREELRLTLREVGSFIGISDSGVAAYEAGKNSAPIGRIKKLAEILKTSPDFLLGETLNESATEPEDAPPWNDSDEETVVIRGAVVYFGRKLQKKLGLKDLESLVDYLIRARYERDTKF